MSESTLPFLHTLYLLRWVAVAGQALTVAAVTGALGMSLDTAPLYGGIAALAGFNLLAGVRIRHLRSATSVEAFAHLMNSEAKRLGMKRSRYISVVLARVARHERDAAVSKRVDEVLAELDEQDLDTIDDLRAARRDEGTKW